MKIPFLVTLLALARASAGQGTQTPDPFQVWSFVATTTPDLSANYSFDVKVRNDVDPYSCSALVPSVNHTLSDVRFTHCSDPYDLVFFQWTRREDGDAALYIQSNFESHCCACESCGTHATYIIPTDQFALVPAVASGLAQVYTGPTGFEVETTQMGPLKPGRGGQG